MAIKTKKITDLSTLGNISAANTFFLGVDNDITGKISYGDILDDVREIVNGTVKTTVPAAFAELTATTEETTTSKNEDVERLEKFVNQMKKELSDVTAAYKSLNSKYTSYVLSTSETILSLQTTIGSQSEKIEKLESFVQAL